MSAAPERAASEQGAGIPAPAPARPEVERKAAADPYLAPAFPLSNRIARALWTLCAALLFRHSPRPLHGWRRFILRCFGARIGADCHIYPKAEIWAPWQLECADKVAIADGAIVYNPAGVRIGSHAVISQQAYLCGATHDYRDPRFPLVARPIVIGDYAWVCARATVQAGVTVGDGAVLALGAVATRDLDAWGVHGGVPARRIGDRPRARAGRSSDGTPPEGR